MQHLASFPRRVALRCPRLYRPFVERLEDRLPPGDAVVAGLLADGFLGRAAGLVPAVTAAPPGQARRLAEPAPFDLELLGGSSGSANPVALAPGGFAAPGSLGALTQPRSPTDSFAPTAASPVASTSGVLSTQYSVLSTQYSAVAALTAPGAPGVSAGFGFAAPTDYRLDQAVASLVLPVDTSATRGTSVQALFDLAHPTTGPFPSNWFTVFDDTQNTWRRVNLPYPDCTVYVSDCEDLNDINALDGFNLQPRLSIPFSGPIDVNTVSYQTVFLVSLGSTTEDEGPMPRGYGVGINQVVWDPEANTLHVESDEFLSQHTRFALYVTNGVPFVAVEPNVRVAVFHCAGGVGFGRLSIGNRSGNGLANRVPPLLNSPGIAQIEGIAVPMPYFHENLPSRDGVVLVVRLADGTRQEIQAPVRNTVAGAMAIQKNIDNGEWTGQARIPTAYAAHLRRAPLAGVPAKSVLFHVAKGDQTVPNPQSTSTIRAAALADRTLYYRHDLTFAEDPTVPRNPHAFLTASNHSNDLIRAIARGGQSQVATFFASDGKTIIHPELRRFFEVPIQGPLPEDLNYIP